MTAALSNPADLDSSAGSVDRRRNLWFALALSLFTGLLFVQTRQFDFINFDDHHYVTQNPRVLQGLTFNNIRWAFTTLKLANWHPLTWISHMLDVSLYGTSPAGHHFTSVLFHSANVGLLYLLFVGMTSAPRRCAIVAALFAVHPLRMESVAWVAERKDVLSGFFFLLTIGCYARYTRAPSAPRYLLIVVCLALGMMSKPMLVTTPCVLLLLDFWPLRRAGVVGARRIVIEKLPLLAMSLASSIITYIAQHRGGTVGEATNYPLALRLANALWSYLRYMQKTIWPSDLAVYYPYLGVLRGTSMPWHQVIIAGTIVIAITLLAVWAWQRERAVLVGWLWFVGMLVPTVGLVQVGGQSMADQYTYLPHIGLFIAIVWGAAAIFRNHPAGLRALGVAAWASIIVLAICTAVQLKHWRNTETLFQHALDVTDHNSRAHICLAIWLTEKGQMNEAAAHYRQALALDPGNPEANNNMGNILAADGQTKDALTHLEQAVRSQPRYAEAHNNLANLLAQQGQIDQAIKHHQAAVRLDPDLPQAHYNYASTLAGTGRMQAARFEAEQALRLRPNYPDARYTYALILGQMGDSAASADQMRIAIRLRPNWPEALNALAWLLATTPDARVRNGPQAIIIAKRACQLTTYENPTPLDTLSAAYAEAGRFDQAIAAATRARQLAESRNQHDLVKKIDARIELYRGGHPYHLTTQPSTGPGV